EETGKVQIVALDKTGTITKGEPSVTDLVPVAGVQPLELLQLAYALEQKSEHPLAKAILQRAQEEQLPAREVTDFTILPGNGLTATLDGARLVGGSLKFIGEQTEIPPELRDAAGRLAGEGKTPLLFTKDGRLAGVIAVADVIKDDSPQAIGELRNMGIHVVMLTGDNEQTARAIGRQAGVSEVIAGVLPDGKESVIRTLMEKGKVAMVGDGINDAPALTRANIGIAIGAGTDIAIDAADIVLMKSRLSDVPAAIRLSRATLRNIHENLFWAFIYNVIGIPLAAGIWIPIFGWELNPMFGAAAMSLSSFCVVSNALRLNFFNIRSPKRDKKIKPIESLQLETSKEETTMEKTMKIEGMMCGHCEATVKKALEKLPEVAEAQVSHTAGTAVVKLNQQISDAALTKAVEEQDYKVLGIQ
ncbi:MAG: metal-transporting ATPase, partial [Clostridiales bacterium]|nr:metal-transporting ATPase [Clostridiales bacterium]